MAERLPALGITVIGSGGDAGEDVEKMVPFGHLVAGCFLLLPAPFGAILLKVLPAFLVGFFKAGDDRESFIC